MVRQLFAGTSSPDTWLQHCKGIGSLMKHRGPAAHANGWEAAMLLYFRGILVCLTFSHSTSLEAASFVIC